MRKAMRFFWRLFLAMLIAMAIPPRSVAQQDVQVSGSSYYVTLATNVPWSQLSQNYIFTPESPSVGLCLFVENNNTSSSHAITVTAFQNGDPSLTSYQASSSKWSASQTSGGFSTIAASATGSEFINVTGAANVAIVIRGTAATSGSPDTANMFVVQTTVQNCGASPPATYVQGDQINGGSVFGINPVYTCGLNGTTCRAFAVDGNGGTMLSEMSTPGDDSLNTQGVLNLANTAIAYALMTAPQLAGPGGNFERVYGISAFNSVAASAAGNTIVWTPTAGHPFDIECIAVDVTEDATQTTAGDLAITLQDGTTTIPGFLWEVYVPATALTGSGDLYTSGTACFPNGYKSTSTANSLNVNLSAALLTGKVIVRAWGNQVR